MKKAFIHIILLLIVAFTQGKAEDLPWRVTPTSSMHTIATGSDMLINGSPIEIGDAIGVFYDSAGIEACGGLVVWDGEDTALVAYGDDSGIMDNGFKVAETFVFRVWDSSEGCEIKNITIVMDDDAPNLGQFAGSGVSGIKSFSAISASITYSDNNFCIGDIQTISPTFSETIDGISFTSIKNGLLIDEVTGTIDVENSTPGVYDINIISSTCLVSNSIQVTIKGFILDDVNIDVVDRTCFGQDGEVNIDESSITKGKAPFIYELTDQFTGTAKVSNEVSINNLDEGVYALKVEDADGCELTLEYELRVRENIDCPTAVITPNGDGGLDGYYINESGEAHIYDRNGILQKSLMVPAKWDGTDQGGSPVPMGSYVIICNGDAKINLTVVR